MLYRLSYTGGKVGMPGLEPGNPEGADLQSAAVAAVPHPHSIFKHLSFRLFVAPYPASEKYSTPATTSCQRSLAKHPLLLHISYIFRLFIILGWTLDAMDSVDVSAAIYLFLALLAEFFSHFSLHAIPSVKVPFPQSTPSSQ